MTASVFIVDDSAPVREMVAEYLSLDPALTVCGTAASGEEALATLPTTPCDLALVDVSMPGMNGIELVRRLAEAAPGVPCVMYSAHVEEVYVRKAQEAGAVGYVMKGNPDELLEALHHVTGGGVFFSRALEAARSH